MRTRPEKLNWRESLPSRVRWKLKYTFHCSEHFCTFVSFWLYWKLCPRLKGPSKRKTLGDKLGESSYHLSRHGIQDFHKLLDSDSLAELNNKIDLLKEKSEEWLIGCSDGRLRLRKDLDTSHYINSEIVRDTEKLYSKDQMLSLAEDHFGEALRNYYGCHFKILSCYSYITYPHSQRPPEGSFRWHIDDHPPGLLKGFIYLNNVGQNQGPFECLPSSHHFSLKKHQDISANASWRFRDDIPKRLGLSAYSITGAAGSSFLVNANTIHRAAPLIEGERRVLCFVFLPSTRPPKESMDKFGFISAEHEADRIHEPVWQKPS